MSESNQNNPAANLESAAAKASSGLTAGLNFAESIAAMSAPEAIAALSAKVAELETKIATSAGTFEEAHPAAAAALLTVNNLMAKLFPNESGLITDMEKLNL